MKKILIFALSALIILSTIVISTFAMDEVPYDYVMQFLNIQKAYPVASSIDDVVPMRSYYETMSFNYSRLTYNDEGVIHIRVTGTEVLITNGHIDGSYPPFSYNIPTLIYDDIGIYVDVNQYGFIDEAYFVGFKDGEKNILTSFSNLDKNYSIIASYYFTNVDNMENGYYVSFPVDPVEVMNDGVVGTIIETIGSFVIGLGSAFAVAFESVFMVNGQLNALSIFLLVLFGCALAYGCIRWITGLFRKET